MVARKKPRGRPPRNYVWNDEMGYIHSDTSALFDRVAHKTMIRTRKAAIERRRYWDPAKHVRARRLVRDRNAKAKKTMPPVLDKWLMRSNNKPIKNTSGKI